MGIDDLLRCPVCGEYMGEDVTAMVCQNCGHRENSEED